MKPQKLKAPWLRDCCYHVSARCYQGVDIFRFANARDQAMTRLRQMKDKYPVKILNYLLHPRGYRLLLAASEPALVSNAIGFFNSTTSKDYAARKQTEGRFWKGRYNITLVHRGHQTLRCAMDMDFTMLREGDEDLFHPLLWKHSGHMELTGIRKRYRLLDVNILDSWFLGVGMPLPTFYGWYAAASTCKWQRGEYREETWWEDALIVADQDLCERVAGGIPERHRQLCVYPAPQSVVVLSDVMSWTIIASRKYKREFILALIP